MHDASLELNGLKVFEVPAQGPELRTGRDAVDIMSAASEKRAALILIPVQRLGDDFFDLRTQIAGEIAQKFSMYGARVAILGDIRQRVEQSKSLAAFVSEANRGDRLWFVESLEELKQRLL
jgi:hypothetical protein